MGSDQIYNQWDDERDAFEARIEMLEVRLRLSQEALRRVEAVMSILEPRSDKAEYLCTLVQVRSVLETKADDGPKFGGWNPDL